MVFIVIGIVVVGNRLTREVIFGPPSNEDVPILMKELGFEKIGGCLGFPLSSKVERAGVKGRVSSPLRREGQAEGGP